MELYQLPDPILNKVTWRLSTGCWEWVGAVGKDGYGKTVHGDKPGVVVPAHRRVWREANGDWPPDGLVLDHTCDNKRCVNPGHLEPVTHAVNVQRGYDRRKVAV